MEGERHGQVYLQCMKNHAATLGTYTVDGCLEFHPDNSQPDGLRCSACGCHRSFHRPTFRPNAATAWAGSEGPAATGYSQQLPSPSTSTEGGRRRRRGRTKFTEDQKERMQRLAESLGWRMPKARERGEGEVEMFCEETGVSRRAFKVWMHNHRRSSTAAADATTGGGNGDQSDGHGDNASTA